MALDILSRRLDEIDEPALEALGRDEIPESTELEFKRELALTSKGDRLEAAKDVSAMANSQGGRILYGVSEVKLSDGTRVAGPLVGFDDGTLPEKLANILVTTVRPRPHFVFQQVRLASGKRLLVVDVRPLPTQIHMVEGYEDRRYYRRSALGVVPMSEQEVRDAYSRVLQLQESAAERERAALEPEEKRRARAEESVYVLPFGVSGLVVDPAAVEQFREDLTGVFAHDLELAIELKNSLRIEADGCRAELSNDGFAYLAILKNGLVHWSRATLFREWRGSTALYSIWCVRAILEGLGVARVAYERVGYRGPVTVRHVMRPPGRFVLAESSRLQPLDARVISSEPQLTYLGLGGHSACVKALLDPIFHEAGEPQASWFDTAGRALPAVRRDLEDKVHAGRLASLLD